MEKQSIHIHMYKPIYLHIYPPIYLHRGIIYNGCEEDPDHQKNNQYMYIPMFYLSSYLPTYLLIQRNGLQWLRTRPRPPRKKQSTYIMNMYIPTYVLYLFKDLSIYISIEMVYNGCKEDPDHQKKNNLYMYLQIYLSSYQPIYLSIQRGMVYNGCEEDPDHQEQDCSHLYISQGSQYKNTTIINYPLFKKKIYWKLLCFYRNYQI